MGPFDLSTQTKPTARLSPKHRAYTAPSGHQSIMLPPMIPSHTIPRRQWRPVNFALLNCKLPDVGAWPQKETSEIKKKDPGKTNVRRSCKNQNSNELEGKEKKEIEKGELKKEHTTQRKKKKDSHLLEPKD